jgi:hypothetical protein
MIYVGGLGHRERDNREAQRTRILFTAEAVYFLLQYPDIRNFARFGCLIPYFYR